MGREELPREVIDEHRRARLLAAAKRVFASRGYRAATVDDIVASAGIGVGSFYAQFSNKEECFAAACRAFTTSARREIAVAAGATAQGARETALRRALEIVAADPDGARLLLVETGAAGRAGEGLRAEALDEAAAALGGRREAAALAWLLGERLAAGREIVPEAVLGDALAITASGAVAG